MQVIPWTYKTKNIHPLERVLSVAGGAALALSGLRRGRWKMGRVLIGMAMMNRGLSGECGVYRALGMRTLPSKAAVPYELGVGASATIMIRRPRAQVFAFWRNLENLPRFMRHLVAVQTLEGGRSHWVAQGPLGRKVEWEAEIVNEVPDELIAWRSLPGSDIDSAGSVQFSDGPQQGMTEIRVELQYNPPAGIVGAYAARLMGRDPEREIQADLKRLKRRMEESTVSSEQEPIGM